MSNKPENGVHSRQFLFLQKDTEKLEEFRVGLLPNSQPEISIYLGGKCDEIQKSAKSVAGWVDEKLMGWGGVNKKIIRLEAGGCW